MRTLAEGLKGKKEKGFLKPRNQANKIKHINVNNHHTLQVTKFINAINQNNMRTEAYSIRNPFNIENSGGRWPDMLLLSTSLQSHLKYYTVRNWQTSFNLVPKKKKGCNKV